VVEVLTMTEDTWTIGQRVITVDLAAGTMHRGRVFDDRGGKLVVKYDNGTYVSVGKARVKRWDAALDRLADDVRNA
jgi:hypothetical protein